MTARMFQISCIVSEENVEAMFQFVVNRTKIIEMTMTDCTEEAGSEERLHELLAHTEIAEADLEELPDNSSGEDKIEEVETEELLNGFGTGRSGAS
jgi:hypothetical protein